MNPVSTLISCMGFACDFRGTYIVYTSLSDLSTSSLVFVYTVGVVQGVDSLVTPALKSIMSKAVSHEDQGIMCM